MLFYARPFLKITTSEPTVGAVGTLTLQYLPPKAIDVTSEYLVIKAPLQNYDFVLEEQSNSASITAPEVESLADNIVISLSFADMAVSMDENDDDYSIETKTDADIPY